MFIFPKEKRERGIFLLRVSLALLFIWFGFDQILHPDFWISTVPDWAASLIPFSAKLTVLLNGAFEIFFGAALLFGFYARFCALILALHMIPIVFSVGYGAIMARDGAITMATFCLYLILPGAFINYLLPPEEKEH